MTDPCKNLSWHFIPKHLAHDVILPGIIVLQLEEDHVSLMISHSLESRGWDGEKTSITNSNFPHACPPACTQYILIHPNITYHHSPSRSPVGSWSTLKEGGMYVERWSLTVSLVTHCDAKLYLPLKMEWWYFQRLLGEQWPQQECRTSLAQSIAAAFIENINAFQRRGFAIYSMQWQQKP